MKRKIGILCFWGVPNYGAWAQAYALNNVVREMVEEKDDVRHIAYLTPRHHSLYYEKDERLYNSFNYSYQLIPHTQQLDATKLEAEEFDVIITGSDAIWEFSVKEMGDDYHLIGNNLNTKQLFAYAPSFGTMSKDMEFKDWIISGLHNYNDITVRDTNSVELVQQLIGRKPSIVLDPVLLWDFNNDENVISPTYQSYIAVYGVQWDEEFIKEAISFAREKGYKLISIGFVNDWCDMSLRMIELRGLEWIGMIKHAEYVFTSTFHGLMFSLVFKKQFKFNRVSYVRNRSESLLQVLKGGMEVYLQNEYEYKKIFEDEVDYNEISFNLKRLREESKKCLREMLGDESI